MKKSTKFCVDKKGQYAALALFSSLAITFVAAIVASAMGSRVLFAVDNTLVDGTVAANITFATDSGLQQIAEFMPILGLLAVATVVLAVVRSF